MRALFSALTTIVKPRGPYKPHVDGLRALAVSIVVFYHVSPEHFPGGFIGVDIFFVISGYLITGILVKALETQSYGHTLLDFYQRRIRRIFPAVSAVLAFCLIIGWLVLFPSEYRALAKHVAAATGFVQNFVLWSEAGYFDADAIQKPLLHFWSLAVEEQFYIFWPFILWFLLRRRWPLLNSIVAIAIVSFALNIWHVESGNTTSAFYLPAARAWELMAGAWLAVAHKHHLPWLNRFPSIQAWAGLALVLLGFGIIRPDMGFPGFWALLPVVGTALLINAGHDTFLNRRIMAWQPVVWIGLISYPLYLWHWVLLSMTHTILGTLSPMLRHAYKLAVPLLSILLAWLTYRFLEQNIRWRKGSLTISALVTAMLVVGVSGLAAVSSGHLQNRPLTLVSTKASAFVSTMTRTSLSKKCLDFQKNTTLRRKYAGFVYPEQWYCELGDATSDTVIVAYGDSHAQSLVPALNAYGKRNGVRVLFTGRSGCLTLLGTFDRKGFSCNILGQKIANLVQRQKPAAAVIIQSWTLYTRPGKVYASGYDERTRTFTPDTKIAGLQALARGLEQTMAFYKSHDIPVVVLQDNPHQNQDFSMNTLRFRDDISLDAIDQTAISRTAYEKSQATVNGVLRDSAAHFLNMHLVDVTNALCNDSICPWEIDGKSLYYNSTHLSVFGAMRVYPLIARALNRVVSQ